MRGRRRSLEGGRRSILFIFLCILYSGNFYSAFYLVSSHATCHSVTRLNLAAQKSLIIILA